MGSDDASTKQIGMFLQPRKWASPILTDELSLQTMAQTAYVKLSHEHMLEVFGSEDADAVKGTKAAMTTWSWLKPASWNGRDIKGLTIQLGLAKSKSHNSRTTRVAGTKASQSSYKFDPNKRWPQGW